MKGDLVELAITDLAFDGKAVAHRDGKVVLLRGGLPGETVLAEITASKLRYDEARVRQIISPSPERVPAACGHFDVCGGCTWQDLTYRRQLEYKTKQVRDCLERLGGLKDVTVHDAIGAAEQFFYRNKMEFSFHAAGDGGFTLGLHRRGEFDEIFDLEACHLQSELSNRIVRWVRDYVRAEKLPVYDVVHHTGYMRFLVIRQTRFAGQVMVNLVTHYGDFPSAKKVAQGLVTAFPEITTIVHNQNGQKSNIAAGEIEKTLYGPGYIEETIFSSRFRIRANSFFQTNSLQARTLYHAAFEMLAPEADSRVLDLYCGTGPIAILIAHHVREVVGVELVPDAVKVARENLVLNEVRNVSFVESDVTAFLKTGIEESQPFDVIIVDPPRAGLHPKALKHLIALKPAKLLYISCNPATFARDAARLTEAGYRLPQVQPVDMFPHTMHIELIAVFHLL